MRRLYYDVIVNNQINLLWQCGVRSEDSRCVPQQAWTHAHWRRPTAPTSWMDNKWKAKPFFFSSDVNVLSPSWFLRGAQVMRMDLNKGYTLLTAKYKLQEYFGFVSEISRRRVGDCGFQWNIEMSEHMLYYEMDFFYLYRSIWFN